MTDKLISAEEMKKEVSRCISEIQADDDFKSPYKDMLVRILGAVNEQIDVQPAVDAVEVVRCKDCNYAETSEHTGCVICTAWGCRSDMDGYCHQAERRKQ